jgi:hypothetical protein
MKDRDDQPWIEDFAALQAQTSSVPSLERTHQFVLASAKPTPDTRKERIMNAVNRRPLIAVAIAVVALAVLAPVAYAVVNNVFLSIDLDQSEQEIENDVEEQLESAGIAAGVSAERSDDQLMLQIHTDDEQLQAQLMGDLTVSVRGKPVGGQIQISIDDLGALTGELTEVTISDEFMALIKSRPAGQSDANLASELDALFAARGFPEIRVTVQGKRITVDRTIDVQ